MQTRRHIRQAQVYISAMLLVFFVSIQMVQIIHAHQCLVECQNHEQAEGDQKRLDVRVSQCKICDYISQSRNEAFYIIKPLLLTVSLPKSINMESRYLFSIGKFTLQAFTNKGPPISTQA